MINVEFFTVKPNNYALFLEVFSNDSEASNRNDFSLLHECAELEEFPKTPAQEYNSLIQFIIKRH